ncbi:hypothetical protein CHH61_03690 [Shouchella clausii]|uniref:Uncharacterized protein n=1 Tax=Shouchella clausii TaxID=79880 RepID=A0A268S4F5_SHOCL|nr:hypothetical protein [Shouchella clausii]PAF27379.1 hypothetical protein CHH61_03690 [Shouchella clausii]
MQTHTDALKHLLIKGKHCADDAMKLAMSDTDDKPYVTLNYVSQCLSYVNAARSIYYSNLNDHENEDIEQLFILFDRFVDEIMDSYETDHSKQHTLIYFQNMKDLYSTLFPS